MRGLGLVFLCLFALGIMGCGGENVYGNAGSTSSSGGGSPSIASLSLTATVPTLGSSSTESVTLYASVKDSNNRVVEGIDVIFSANGGSLVVTSDTTSASGVAEATLSTANDPRNRTIRVTATAGDQTDYVDIAVVGTAINVNGASSLVLGASTTLTIFLKDSAGAAIPNTALTVSSAKGNSLSASTVTTGSSGQAQVTINGTQAGVDTITVSGLGTSTTFSITVSSDQFSFTAPSATDLDIGVAHTVSVTWTSGGAPVSGQPVNFSATRGTLSAASVNTNGSGVATVTITSNNAGPTVITASTTSGPSTSITREFVAITPDALDLQVDKATVGINGEQATLTAILRDASGNLVKGKTIQFEILEDLSGGSLLNASAVTDSQGKASTVYTSTSVSTAKDGVRIQAKLLGATCPTALCDEQAITVAQSQVFVKLGAGNEINILDEVRYQYPYGVLVTDSGGNPVANTDVVITLIPTYYYRGVWDWQITDPTMWVATHEDQCANEDVDLDGVLDVGEDFNNSLALEPRNVASVETTVKTDQSGFGIMHIVYAKQYGHWVDVKLTASVSVSGTESISSAEFTLPVASNDLTNSVKSPPPAPFGAGACSDPLN
ncbi:MAG: Ig-like domain-containing protein [Pseudomonadota bacterium]